MGGHTPGPWSIDDAGAWINIYGSESDDANIVAKIEITDGSTDYLHDQETARANARLIAAAPELLEALEALLGNCLDSEGLAAAHAKARAALAKAGGES